MSDLFRPEILINRVDRLSGNIMIAVPISWQSIGYLMFGGVAAAFAFLSLANYSRVETATGAIVPDKGVSSIFPTRRGVVLELWVRDGQQVASGAQLALIRTEEDSASGISMAAQITAAENQQDASLVAQVVAANAAADAQVQQRGAQRQGLVAEIRQLETQIALQRELIQSAQRDYDRASVIAERGFISQSDLQFREETLLARRQSLSQLNQTLGAKRSALLENDRSAAQIAAQAQAQAASSAANRAQLAQQAANTAGGRSYVLRAPVTGRVTALAVRKGQVVSPENSLLAIVPSGAALRAELAVPSAAIGFVRPGQEVRLAIDAFPYQRFGIVRGKVLTVAESSVTIPGSQGSAIPVYPVTVSLDHAWVSAFGRKESLVPGMTLTARIVAEKQSLIEWLFEPLYAVRQR